MGMTGFSRSQGVPLHRASTRQRPPLQ